MLQSADRDGRGVVHDGCYVGSGFDLIDGG